MVGRWFWVHKIVFTGGLPPPRPPAVPGGLPAPQTPWRGACSPPCPPAYREAPPLGLSVDLGTKILVPRSWYQDLGTKIRVQVAWFPTKESLRGGASHESSKGCSPQARGLGGWKPPRKSRGSGGRQPPSKNNFMDPEPPSDHLQPLPTICQPPSTTFLPPSTTYQPPSPSTANHYHF